MASASLDPEKIRESFPNPTIPKIHGTPHCVSDAEVMGRPVDLGDYGIWEALPDLLQVERCQRHDVGVAGGLGFFGVYLGWGRTAIGGGVAVTTVNSM